MKHAIVKQKNILEGLKKFQPILASCHQGQRRSGVDAGAGYIYDNCF
jgi:arginase